MQTKFDVGDWVFLVKPRNMASLNHPIGIISGPVKIKGFESTLKGDDILYTISEPREYVKEECLFSSFDDALEKFKQIVEPLMGNVTKKEDPLSEKVEKLIEDSKKKMTIKG